MILKGVSALPSELVFAITTFTRLNNGWQRRRSSGEPLRKVPGRCAASIRRMKAPRSTTHACRSEPTISPRHDVNTSHLQNVKTNHFRATFKELQCVLPIRGRRHHEARGRKDEHPRCCMSALLVSKAGASCSDAEAPRSNLRRECPGAADRFERYSKHAYTLMPDAPPSCHRPGYNHRDRNAATRGALVNQSAEVRISPTAWATPNTDWRMGCDEIYPNRPNSHSFFYFSPLPPTCHAQRQGLGHQAPERR